MRRKGRHKEKKQKKGKRRERDRKKREERETKEREKKITYFKLPLENVPLLIILAFENQ